MARASEAVQAAAASFKTETCVELTTDDYEGRARACVCVCICVSVPVRVLICILLSFRLLS